MHKIYCFNNGGSPNFLEAIAIGDDGVVLASHICSDESFMAHDLGITSTWKHEHYNDHFGEGNWELIWIPNPINNEDLNAVIELNRKIENENILQKEQKTRTHVTFSS